MWLSPITSIVPGHPVFACLTPFLLSYGTLDLLCFEGGRSLSFTIARPFRIGLQLVWSLISQEQYRDSEDSDSLAALTGLAFFASS